MFSKVISIAFSLAFLATTQVVAIIPIGGLCAGFAGPVNDTCESGSICCYVSPDRALCAAVTECPAHFVPEGSLCSGIAGPSPYPCTPGTSCCHLSPDNSQCLARCRRK